MKVETLTGWTVNDAVELYGIRNWGLGYFDINEEGEVVVRPQGKAGTASTSLKAIIADLQARGVSMPVLLRFSDVLARIRRTGEAKRDEAPPAAAKNGTE